MSKLHYIRGETLKLRETPLEELITIRAKKLALERRSNVLSIVKTSIQTGQSAAKPLKIIRKPGFKYPDQQIIHEEGSETKQVSGIHIGSSG